MTVMRKVVGTLKLLRSAQANKVAHKLTCAGWRHKDAIVRFFFAKFALPFLFGGIAVVLLYVLDAYSMTSTWKEGTALGATLFGAYLPDIMVYNADGKSTRLNSSHYCAPRLLSFACNTKHTHERPEEQNKHLLTTDTHGHKHV